MPRTKIGDPCRSCGFELVEISRKTLIAIQALRPTIHSIRKRALSSKSEKLLICPKCDAYALGIELREGFPFKDKNGIVRTIKDI